MITIIELVGEFDMLPLRAVRKIEQADQVILQSGQAECAQELGIHCGNVSTLDDLYENAEDFDSLYEKGAQRIEQAAQGKNIVFGILGDAGTNGFLERLREMGAELEFVAEGCAVAAALCAARNLFEIGEYEVLEARNLEGAIFDTCKALVITGIDNRNTAEAVKLAFADYYAEDTQGLLYANGSSQAVKLYDFDRPLEIGSGGVFILPPTVLYKKERYGLYDLVRIMKVLRGENGCPWDREQTHESLRQYLLEEAYETVDAIDAEDINALYDELGDVFLQVVFHAEVARQCGEFDIDDVASAVCAKMIRRHPHIFGDVQADTAKEVVVNWEAIKKEEKQAKDFAEVLRDVPRSMGAMMRAYKLQKKASAIGFDWDDPMKAFLKVEEELAEWKAELCGGDQKRIEEEAGDLLFSIVNVLRLKKANPEICLSKTCEKFIERLSLMEKNFGTGFSGLTLDQLNELWEKAKKKA